MQDHSEGRPVYLGRELLRLRQDREAGRGEPDVDFSTKGFKGLQPQIREVLFVDTEDYKLYNNAFILRRRIPYQHGFVPPAGGDRR